MSKRPNYVFDDELYHWGILGQKWGTRRFQNEDGSWTPEGRERYGKGDDPKTKARIAYNTQKYKADLKSKAQKEKDIRAAKEERNRIKENSKTMLLARKKQSKFDILNKKEEAKLNNYGRPKASLANTKNLSDEELQNAINRLKLQAEYNKQYILATQPNNALIKADRFFEGPTGKMVSQIAINTIPDLVKQSAGKILDKKLAGDKSKYEDPLDKAAKEAEIRRTNAQASSFESVAQKNFSDIQKNSSNNEKITQEIISLPRANPNNARSSDIGRTQAIQTPYIGKTESVSPAPGTPGGRRLYAWEANELNKKKKKS